MERGQLPCVVTDEERKQWFLYKWEKLEENVRNKTCNQNIPHRIETITLKMLSEKIKKKIKKKFYNIVDEYGKKSKERCDYSKRQCANRIWE